MDVSSLRESEAPCRQKRYNSCVTRTKQGATARFVAPNYGVASYQTTMPRLRKHDA
jgi:hypothetical protein